MIICVCVCGSVRRVCVKDIRGRHIFFNSFGCCCVVTSRTFFYCFLINSNMMKMKWRRRSTLRQYLHFKWSERGKKSQHIEKDCVEKGNEKKGNGDKQIFSFPFGVVQLIGALAMIKNKRKIWNRTKKGERKREEVIHTSEHIWQRRTLINYKSAFVQFIFYSQLLYQSNFVYFYKCSFSFFYSFFFIARPLSLTRSLT